MVQLIALIAVAAVASCGAPAAVIATATLHPTQTPTLFSTTTAPSTTPSIGVPAFRYVAIGASDTAGVGAADPRTGSWPARLAARLPATTDYQNLGVSGSVASQAAHEQVPGAVALRPQLITVWLAVNDLNAGLSPVEYAAALRSVIEPLVQRTEAKIFIGTTPDLRAVPAYAGTDIAAMLARIVAYNTAIAGLAIAYPGRVMTVDLFAGSAALTSTITVSGDGFHPSDAGYALIADRFVSAIAAAGVPLR